jgi:hypothetical protein
MKKKDTESFRIYEVKEGLICGTLPSFGYNVPKYYFIVGIINRKY